MVGSDEEPCVQCPWHASIFRFEDGGIERGPATAEQPVLEARINEGKVELRAAGAGGGA
jgi:nitrite reductase/ring-hydroxylating ferredoxin subunit